MKEDEHFNSSVVKKLYNPMKSVTFSEWEHRFSHMHLTPYLVDTQKKLVSCLPSSLSDAAEVFELCVEVNMDYK